MDDIVATMKVTRTGAYALIQQGNLTLLEKRSEGPYAGKWDLPGQKIDAEETPEETIKRTIEENLRGSYIASHLKYAWTATFRQDHFLLHQIGLIYEIEGYQGQAQEWKDLSKMADDELAPLAINAKLIQ